MFQYRYNDIQIVLYKINLNSIFICTKKREDNLKCLVQKAKLKKKLNILTVTQPLEAPFTLPI